MAGVSRAANGGAFSSLVELTFKRPTIIAVLLASLAFAGCEADVSSPSAAERTALLAPDFIASTAAAATDNAQAKWLLNQSKPVRESYVRDVLDRKGDRALRSTAWLLRQADGVRESYLREVVDPQLAP